ncbi:IEC3 subunit of the Ino80 complex, chromatin re-modelling-domain-containing protein [Calycina marina]|uniref:IEC3 subunit of the Ino80 complex, chromatin re-modelling-domain-containing protein n=1 Tax=Calycina marina TaxID=1763456 RepID=A0A9P8CF91_9HELO|nr:IEC3 subunit of the Ino80 complex, chromatin re-modelling-domain-containing protein [Calycina marina]
MAEAVKQETPMELDMNMDMDRSTMGENLPQSEGTNHTYKSFKKKYRKMRLKFDETMRQSNDLFTSEHAAKETARRLAQQNDQLMELLFDVNNSAQIPADKRIDLSFKTPALAEVPPLISSSELAEVAKLSTPAGQAIHKDITSILSEKAALKASSRPPKSLAYLLNSTHHLTSRSPQLSHDLKDLGTVDGAGPVAYMTADQIDDYIYDIDISLGKSPITPHHYNPTPENLGQTNPVSVYNWLRKHEPRIFLQDGEGSEKSHGKPGSLRGAGKRASMPMPSHGDALEIVEEDGLGYDPTIAGLDPGVASKGKRKREDDGGYHPKLGAPDGKAKKPRSRKKKESLGEGGGTPASSRKGKSKPKVSSPMAVDGASAGAP